MDDKELADRIVALGVARTEGTQYFMLKGQPHTHNTAEQFVRDWRVAGALLSKLSAAEKAGKIKETDIQRIFSDLVWQSKFDDPRAINEACVEALE